jgi:hypothetical protein
MGDDGKQVNWLESLLTTIDQIGSSLIVQNAFWVFVGIVAGSIIQFLFHYIILRSQRKNAKQLFRAEIEINEGALAQVEAAIRKKKERFSAHQQTESDYWFDFKSFNYRMVDPLINSGHFHAILGPEGVKRYFEFMNELNVEAAVRAEQLLRREDDEKKSLAYLDWFLDTKIPYWKETLRIIRSKA